MTQVLPSTLPLPWENQPYSVKRHGLTITNCDMEPVQTPGCIQAHGALLVLRLSDLSILQASDNTVAVLQQAAESLLGQPVSLVIGHDGEAQLRVLLAKESTDHNPLYLLTLPREKDGTGELDVTVHTVNGVVVAEFEATGRGSASAPDYYALVKTTVARLQNARSLKVLYDVVADEIRELTGHDRVMVYKFHADGHGEVVAESRRADLEPWLGLHYPAQDIPKPAREVFTKTWIRPVPDVSGALAELLPLVNPDTGLPLDMTHCALRGVSSMYTEYLHNMKVDAALTLAIRRNERLWGLIACHHYTGPKHVSHQMRAASEFLAQVVSLQNQAAEEREVAAYRLHMERVHQQVVASTSKAGDVACLMDGSPSLLDGIHSGGVALHLDQRWLHVGNTPDAAQLDSLKEWLIGTYLASGIRLQYATDHLSDVYPDAAPYAKVASGLMAVPLSLSERNILLWFRPETLQTVNWGGNPHDKPMVAGPHGLRLSPRHSFELFSESVHERSLPWIPAEIDAAANLRLALLDLLASQQAHRLDPHADMAQSNEELDAFAYVASQDLKEPLHTIRKYASELLDDSAALGNESRTKLDRMLRLTVRMDGLLESILQLARVGGTRAAFKRVDLNKTVDEALDIVVFRGIEGRSVTMPRPLPVIDGNEVQCRQIYVNLLSNAIKYSKADLVHVELGHIGPIETHARPGCPPGSEKDTIFYVADDGIGLQAKDFEQVFKLFKRLHGQNDYGGGAGAGLTIVSKLVGQHGGKAWVDAVPDQGATFYFTLPGKAVSASVGKGPEILAL